MAGNRDQDRWSTHRENREAGERRPWEGYRKRTGQAPDYGSAGGQYFAPVGPDQNPYTEDEGAYAGARNRDYSGQGNYHQGVQRDWEREGRGGSGGYGQVGGHRETAADEGGYSRGSRSGGLRHHGQGGFGEEQDWGRDRGDFRQHGQGRSDRGSFDYRQGNPPDAGQLAYGPGSQSYGQSVSNHHGQEQSGYGGDRRGYGDDRARGPQQHDAAQHADPDYRQWRQDQARKYDEDYGSWRQAQLRQHDDDYAKWRDERRDKFGKDFSDWSAQNRSAPGSSGQQGGGPASMPGQDKDRKH